MKNRYFLFVIIFYLSIQTYGQNEIDIYNKIYKTADSLKAVGKVGYMDSDSLFIKIKETEQKHPPRSCANPFALINDFHRKKYR